MKLKLNKILLLIMTSMKQNQNNKLAGRKKKTMSSKTLNCSLELRGTAEMFITINN